MSRGDPVYRVVYGVVHEVAFMPWKKISFPDQVRAGNQKSTYTQVRADVQARHSTQKLTVLFWLHSLHAGRACMLVERDLRGVSQGRLSPDLVLALDLILKEQIWKAAMLSGLCISRGIRLADRGMFMKEMQAEKYHKPKA